MVNVKRIRVDKGMTQTFLAKKLGVKPNTISQWESGNRNPGLEMVRKIAQVLECSVDELLGVNPKIKEATHEPSTADEG